MAATKVTTPNGATETPPTVEHASLAEALLAAQIEMPAVDRDGTNPHFKSKFTTLGHLLAKVRPVLNRHGLVLVQAPVLAEGQPCLRTTITHRSGDSVTDVAPLSAAKPDPQGQGSAITYMRRYALASALAIADQEDDDGNAASNGGGGGGNGKATTQRREGQGDGKSSQATAAQRKKIHAVASNLALQPHQLKAWIEWNAGTAHTDRIEKAKASELIEALEGAEDAQALLGNFNAALDAGDERAVAIATKHSPSKGGAS